MGRELATENNMAVLLRRPRTLEECSQATGSSGIASKKPRVLMGLQLGNLHLSGATKGQERLSMN